MDFAEHKFAGVLKTALDNDVKQKKRTKNMAKVKTKVYALMNHRRYDLDFILKED